MSKDFQGLSETARQALHAYLWAQSIRFNNEIRALVLGTAKTWDVDPAEVEFWLVDQYMSANRPSPLTRRR